MQVFEQNQVHDIVDMRLQVDVGAVEMQALAEPGERGAVDGVAVAGEELTGALPLPAAGGGAMDDDEGVFLAGRGGVGTDRRQDDEADQQGNESQRMGFHEGGRLPRSHHRYDRGTDIELDMALHSGRLKSRASFSRIRRVRSAEGGASMPRCCGGRCASACSGSVKTSFWKSAAQTARWSAGRSRIVSKACSRAPCAGPKSGASFHQ